MNSYEETWTIEVYFHTQLKESQKLKIRKAHALKGIPPAQPIPIKGISPSLPIPIGYGTTNIGYGTTFTDAGVEITLKGKNQQFDKKILIDW